MGACYSSSAKDQENTPKSKKPHSRKEPKNGLALKANGTHDEDSHGVLSESKDLPEEDKSRDAQRHVEQTQNAKRDESNSSLQHKKSENKVVYDKEVVDGPEIINNTNRDSDKGALIKDANSIDELGTTSDMNSENLMKTVESGCAPDVDSTLSSSLPSHIENSSHACEKNEVNEEKISLHDQELVSTFNVSHCACCRLSNYGEFPAFLKNSLQNKRNSDILPVVLKPSLKKAGHKSNRNCRLSWKSEHSLDWTGNLFGSLDRSQSEMSEVFYDELNLHAPLAEFDSLEFLGSSSGLSNNVRDSMIDYQSDTFKFQFDFSGLDTILTKSESTPVTPLHKKASYLRQHSLNLENVNTDGQGSKRSSLELRGFDSTTSLELGSALESLQDVKTMEIDGKEVVVIEKDVYIQVMDELASLRHKLGLLTDIINEADILASGTSRDRSSIAQE